MCWPKRAVKHAQLVESLYSDFEATVSKLFEVTEIVGFVDTLRSNFLLYVARKSANVCSYMVSSSLSRSKFASTNTSENAIRNVHVLPSNFLP